jgi:hypothetical protein
MSLKNAEKVATFSALIKIAETLSTIDKAEYAKKQPL